MRQLDVTELPGESSARGKSSARLDRRGIGSRARNGLNDREREMERSR